MRECFARLRSLVERFAKSDAAFLAFKARRAAQRWRRHTQHAVALTQQATAVATRATTRTLRVSGWTLWRSQFLLSMRTRTFETLRRHRFAVRVWRAFVAATESQRQTTTWRCRAAHLVAHQVRARVWRSWLRFQALAREKRRIVAQAREHHRMWTLRRVLLALSTHQSSALSAQAADAHFMRRIVREWRAVCVCSRHAETIRIQQLSTICRRVVLRAHVQRLALFVKRRRRKRCVRVLSVWKQLLRSSLACALLACCGRKVQLASLWWRWRAAVCQATALRKRAEVVRVRRHHLLRREFFLEKWRHRVWRYRQARTKLKRVQCHVALRLAVDAWRQLKCDCDRMRSADATYTHALKRSGFRALVQVVIRVRATVQRWQLQRLAARWQIWRQFVERRRLLRTAAHHWERLRQCRTVSKLLVHARNRGAQRQQSAVADAWAAAVLLQCVWSAWIAFVEKRVHVRQSAQALEWSGVGRRAWLEWRRALVREQYVRLARDRANRMLLQTAWNALVQITKRRQVAKSMWRYTLARVRLERSVQRWQRYVEMGAQQALRARDLTDKVQRRCLRRLFSAWSQFGVMCAFAAVRAQRKGRQQTHACWRAWVVYCRVRCVRREATRKLLRQLLVVGLQRNAVQSQAARRVGRYHEVHVLRQALKRWRIELWLRTSQRAVDFRLKESVLERWRRFAARRQTKRASVASALQQQQHCCLGVDIRGNWRRRACRETLCESQQAAVDVLQAWHLAAKCQRRSRCRDETKLLRRGFVVDSKENRALRSNSEASGGSQWQPVRQKSSSLLPRRHPDASYRLPTGNVPAAKARRGADDLNLLGLEFWATRLVATCFYSWRHLTRTSLSVATQRGTKPQRERYHGV